MTSRKSPCLHGLPKAYCKQLATTKPLSALAPRSSGVPTSLASFQNDEVILWLVGALRLEQNDEWQPQRRYIPLEGMAAVSDDQAARLSAVITDERSPRRAAVPTPRAGTRPQCPFVSVILSLTQLSPKATVAALIGYEGDPFIYHGRERDHNMTCWYSFRLVRIIKRARVAASSLIYLAPTYFREALRPNYHRRWWA